MNCEVCGTELPHGALFCGECGRAVGARVASALHPDSGMPVDAPAPHDANDPVVIAGPRDTTIIEPVVRNTLPELETQVGLAPVSAEPNGIEQDLSPDILAEEAVADGAATEEPVSEPDAGTTEQPFIEPAAYISPRRTLASAMPAVNSGSRPDAFPWGGRGAAVFSDSDELEQTLIVPRRETGERFVLQFSTGESVTVFGTGLLGRNPVPQPTEYFDQLVSISDPGKSVSKTHLEFGQEAGSFWVSDRFSGNGSAVREPESSLRRLVAGKRYRIVRGTRVDIGEQFFVVS